MLNVPEYLLTKLMEECTEVTQRASKIMTFGLLEVQPGYTYNNADRLTHEMGDLMAIWSMMVEAGMVKEPTIS